MIRYVVQLETLNATWIDAYRGIYSDKDKAIGMREKGGRTKAGVIADASAAVLFSEWKEPI